MTISMDANHVAHEIRDAVHDEKLLVHRVEVPCDLVILGEHCESCPTLWKSTMRISFVGLPIIMYQVLGAVYEVDKRFASAVDDFRIHRTIGCHKWREQCKSRYDVYSCPLVL